MCTGMNKDWMNGTLGHVKSTVHERKCLTQLLKGATTKRDEIKARCCGTLVHWHCSDAEEEWKEKFNGINARSDDNGEKKTMK